MLVENYQFYRIKSLILLNDFLCPACNVTCVLGSPRFKVLETFMMLKHVFLSRKTLIFANKAKLPIHYVKVGSAKGSCALSTWLWSGIFQL